MKLSNIKIATKLYSVILIALIGMIGMAGMNHTNIYNAANYAIINTVPSVLLMSDALVNFYAIRIEVRNHILNTDLDKISSIEKRIQKYTEIVDKSLVTYGETMISNDEDKRLLDLDRVLLAKFLASIEPVMALSRQNKNDEARDLLTRNSVPKEFANQTSFITTAIMFILVSIFSWIIANLGLSRPINEVVDALKQLADGKINVGANI